MKRKDIAILVGIGLVAALISSLIAGKIFNASGSRQAKVEVVAPIDSTFPDVKNDSNYNTVFNNNALDPTQLIKIGPAQNQQPFSNGQ